MGDIIRCARCRTHHYRNDGCPDDKPRKVFRFDAESYCLIYCREHSDVVQVTSNIADAEVAEMMAYAIRKRGGHVIHSVPAGVLVAAIELVKSNQSEVSDA